MSEEKENAPLNDEELGKVAGGGVTCPGCGWKTA